MSAYALAGLVRGLVGAWPPSKGDPSAVCASRNLPATRSGRSGGQGADYPRSEIQIVIA